MQSKRSILLLAYGFRPFFLFTGLYAVLSVSMWLGVYAGAIPLPEAYSPTLWHGHEMLFGFAAAGLCGFLLTAVPNWTQTEAVKDGRLGILVVLWLSGRLAFGLADFLPWALVAFVDLLFIPALAWMIGTPIFARRQKRNYFFPALLVTLFIANILYHLEVMGLTENTAQSALYMGLYIFVSFISLISGRVVPNFTAAALRVQGMDVQAKISMPLELASFAGIVVTAIVDLTIGNSMITGVFALASATLLGLRMKNWHSTKILGDPLLWVLHIGGSWLVLGMVCLGLSELTGFISKSTAFHALTIGAIGSMVMGIMSRASLGHTGRPFVLAKAVPVAYLLISLAALARVAATALMPSEYDTFIIVAGLFWIAAFSIFTVVYWPILTKPRLDGRPG